MGPGVKPSEAFELFKENIETTKYLSIGAPVNTQKYILRHISSEKTFINNAHLHVLGDFLKVQIHVILEFWLDLLIAFRFLLYNYLL